MSFFKKKKTTKHLTGFRPLAFIEKDFQYILPVVANAFLLTYRVCNTEFVQAESRGMTQKAFLKAVG